MYNTIIVGAGQAGLSMGYYLQKLGRDFLILDKGNEIGQVWKKRYDSLKLFTSRQYSSLPGLQIEGEPNSLPNKDEIATYLKLYAETFQLPIKLHTEVYNIEKEVNYFTVFTKGLEYKSKNVIIATGPFQHPNIPTFASNLGPDVLQLHSSEYKNPTQLKEGNVLVVGAGNSGAQIAVETSAERNTYLSSGRKLKFMPLHVGKRSIFWWLDKLQIYKANTSSFLGKRIQKLGDPIFGYELKQAINENTINIVGRALDAKEDSIITENPDSLKVQNVIWATGFKPDYYFLESLSGIIDMNGYPIHRRGVTNTRGLFFLGLPWQSNRGSALLQGVGYDARYIVEHLID